MLNLRFGHFFAVLMLAAFLSAFVVPARFTNPARGELDGLFRPVAQPVRWVALGLLRRAKPETAPDVGSPGGPRTDESVREQNRQLLLQLTTLSAKFDDLSRLNADRQLIGGDLRGLCRPATVTGADSSGLRQALLIGPMFAKFNVGEPVLFAGGIVGRIDRTGVTGSEVRLVTDEGFSCTGSICHYDRGPDGKTTPHWIEHLTPLVQGIGSNAMAVRNTVTLQQVQNLKIAVHDMVALSDNDWPANLKGYWLGQITSIQPQSNAPLFAEIRIEPTLNLLRLRDVMVMVKE